MKFDFRIRNLTLKSAAMKKNFLSAAFVLLLCSAMSVSNELSAQSLSLKVGNTDEKEKKEETKEKVVVKEVEKSGPTLEQELKKVFGMKSETSIGGARIENIGKFFLDKYTGQVTVVAYHKGEPVRWNILRDKVAEDIVDDPETVNYQLIKYGNGNDDILLLNLNSGTMWVMDTSGFSYRNTRLIFIPAVDAAI